MKQIRVGKKKAVVDPIDFDYLSNFKWRMHNVGYAQTGNPSTLMHRLVLERKLGRPITYGMVTDHINSDKLDNRRANLRELSRGDNIRLAAKTRLGKTSQYIGVSQEQQHTRWRA